jgi:3-deoxy-D-manno-octulosonic-acid transferase
MLLMKNDGVFFKYAYRIISEIISPLIILYIRWRILKNKESAVRYKERYGIASAMRPEGMVIWIHAVSVGETLSIVPFIKKLRTTSNEIFVLLTTTTLASAAIIEQQLHGIVVHQFVPFDVYRWIKRFIEYWKPNAVCFVESELWPNILYCLKKRNLPVYLLNARCSSKSQQKLMVLKKYFHFMPFESFKSVYTTLQDMAIQITKLGASNVIITPSLKLLSPKLPTNQKTSKKLQQAIKDRLTWMAVSTHHKEEQIILDVHHMLKKKHPTILTIIAPRHPARKNEIINLCASMKLSYVSYSDSFAASNLCADVCIVDEIGCLGEFFENISTVLVCGSLIPGIGGHNFLEPLRFGCSVAMGKYFDNFRDVYNSVSDVCTVTTSLQEICEFVEKSSKMGHQELNIKVDEFSLFWDNIIKSIAKDINL